MWLPQKPTPIMEYRWLLVVLHRYITKSRSFCEACNISACNALPTGIQVASENPEPGGISRNTEAVKVGSLA